MKEDAQQRIGIHRRRAPTLDRIRVICLTAPGLLIMIDQIESKRVMNVPRASPTPKIADLGIHRVSLCHRGTSWHARRRSLAGRISPTSAGSAAAGLVALDERQRQS